MHFIKFDTYRLSANTPAKGTLVLFGAVIFTFSPASGLDTDFARKLMYETRCRLKSLYFPLGQHFLAQVLNALFHDHTSRNAEK